jgi:sRNA-binding carbon storage regulator CsrA
MKTRLTLARHEALKIGEEITITARHDGGQVSIEIESPARITIKRITADDHENKAPPARVRWLRKTGGKI